MAEVCPSWDRKKVDTLHLTVDACAQFCTHRCRVFVCLFFGFGFIFVFWGILFLFLFF